MLRGSGNLGKLQVGYQTAVTIRLWSLTCSQDLLATVDWKLEATVDSIDGYWSTQPPTEIRLQMDVGIWWRWTEDVRLSGTIVPGKKVSVTFRGSPDIRTGA
jgi:hypothetical protein